MENEYQYEYKYDEYVYDDDRLWLSSYSDQCNSGIEVDVVMKWASFLSYLYDRRPTHEWYW